MGGRYVFGTRDPGARARDGLHPSGPFDVVDHAGRPLRLIHPVESVAGGVVTLTETTATREGEPLRTERARLRFLDADGIGAFLAEAGFTVDGWYGDGCGAR